jgi:hypothetical protein
MFRVMDSSYGSWTVEGTEIKTSRGGDSYESFSSVTESIIMMLSGAVPYSLLKVCGVEIFEGLRSRNIDVTCIFSFCLNSRHSLRVLIVV